MVWAGIWNDSITGPYFFDENVMGAMYLNTVGTFLFPVLEDMPLVYQRKLWFQQDGVCPHFATAVFSS
jgi:hypothetical protein